MPQPLSPPLPQEELVGRPCPRPSRTVMYCGEPYEDDVERVPYEAPAPERPLVVEVPTP